MFNLGCGNCGKPEIVHYKDLEKLTRAVSTNTWATWEYHEEPEFSRHETSRQIGEYFSNRGRGYHHSLETCPAFQYKKKDYAELVCRFCAWLFYEYHQKESPSDQELRAYLRDDLGVDSSPLKELLFEKAKSQFMEFEKEEEEKSGRFILPVTTYILVGMSGRSVVMMGD